MTSPASDQIASPSNYPSQEHSPPSDFWQAVRTIIQLQHQAPPILPIPRDTPLPLSFGQERERLWFLNQLQPNNLAYWDLGIFGQQKRLKPLRDKGLTSIYDFP